MRELKGVGTQKRRATWSIDAVWYYFSLNRSASRALHTPKDVGALLRRRLARRGRGNLRLFMKPLSILEPELSS